MEYFTSEILDTFGFGTISMNNKGDIISINQATKRMFRIGNGIKSLGNLNDLHKYFYGGEKIIKQIKRNTQLSMKKRKIISPNEKTIILSNKKEMAVKYQVFPMLTGKNGKRVKGSILVFNDITEKRTTEKNLIESQKKLQAIFDGITDGIMVIDQNLKIVNCNKAMQIIFNRGLKEIVGKSCYEVCHGNTEICDDCTAYDALESGKSVSRLKHCFQNDGKNKLMEIWNFPMDSANGQTGHIIEYVKDVSEREFLHKELAQSKRLALIGEVSAKIAHEVRNPLHAIEGAAHFLLNEFKDNKDISQYSKLIKDQVVRLNKVTYDVLNFSKPSKPINTEIKKCDIEAIIHRSVEALKDKFIKNEVRVTLIVCSLTPPIMADENQLTQMFTNLFINASDAMPKGGNLIVYTKIEANPKSNTRVLNINVKDMGIGMPSKDIKKMFKPFYTTKPKGTGLGLAIVQKIVQNHKGSIRVESKKNKGTNIIISFPVVN
tara:strand:+ start:16775 stop:18244 length:1470 start_codon:yes stop_codon:yes gene_type:complete